MEKEKKIEKPFELAINNLKKITSVTSPIHKIKIIYKTYLLINENIKSFYFKYGIKYNGIIESDEVLAIFIYLCSKCEIENLYAECSLIEKFIADQVANSLTGYYLISLKSALLCLSEGDFLKKECGS